MKRFVRSMKMQRRLLVSAVVLCVALLAAQATADFTLSEEVLLSSEFFTKAWGPATASRTDVAGDGVRYDFSGLTGSGTGIKDDYPVQDKYGQVPSSHNGDFSNFDGYSLWVQNIGTTSISFSLFMNTGFTKASGTPPNDGTNDTFWQSDWQELGPWQTSVVRLDFDDARAWNISDNKSPHTQGGLGAPEGGWYEINNFDLTQVSAIGFEVTGSGGATILVRPVPEPASILLGVLGMSTAGWLMKRRRERTRPAVPQ